MLKQLAAQLRETIATETDGATRHKAPAIALATKYMEGGPRYAKPRYASERKPPHDSNILVTGSDDGVILSLPPCGIVRGSKGMIFFAIIWSTLIGFFSWKALREQEQPIPIVLIVPFGIAVFYMLLNAARRGRRSARIEVTHQGEELTIAQRGLLHASMYQIRRDDICAIRVYNEARNGPRSLVVEVTRTQGRPLRLFRERSDKEIHWLAAVLRQRLGITPDREE
jgi:hypothetical protein